ncbi:MAG: BMP family ABC transporter substrate-binding protein [Synergistaceae bacterium]|jgi:basic membrane protein A|nr:BMP family ABC transporter substrate-binding protein [Synergistaceae bacterium]
MPAKRILALVLPLAALCFAASSVFAAMPAAAPEDMNPGFVYVGPAADGGWSYMHDQGRKLAETHFPGIKTSIVESVPEGPDAERVIETFIRSGSKVIFATSFGYMDPVQNVAARNPGVIFMHCSGYKRADNVGTYFGRIYQPRYLSGIVAGSMTKSNVIGYVAAYPIPEVIRGLNAFTLGVRRANPKAEVRVVWLFSWLDPAQEKEATRALYDLKADVIGMHADTGSAPQTAEELGIYVVGYNNDMSNYAPTKHLTSPIWHWDKVYDHVLGAVQAGTWKPEDIWWGLSEGLVDLAPFGQDVPDSVKALVTGERQKITSGEWDVFHGPIKDQTGAVRVPEGSKLTDAEMLSIDWYVEGIVGEMPK